MDIRFKPLNNGLTKTLGPLEAEIMQQMWREQRSTVKQMHTFLGQRRELAYTTVMTTMQRLATKGILLRERTGQTDWYAPALSEEELGAMVVHQVLDSLLSDHGAIVTEYIVEYLAAHDPAKLQRILERKTSRG